MAKSFLKRVIFMIKAACRNQTKNKKIVMVLKNLNDQKENVIKAYRQVELLLSKLAPRSIDDFEVSTQKLLVNLQDTPAYDEQLASQGFTNDGFISKLQGAYMVEVIRSIRMIMHLFAF